MPGRSPGSGTPLRSSPATTSPPRTWRSPRSCAGARSASPVSCRARPPRTPPPRSRPGWSPGWCCWAWSCWVWWCGRCCADGARPVRPRRRRLRRHHRGGPLPRRPWPRPGWPAQRLAPRPAAHSLGAPQPHDPCPGPARPDPEPSPRELYRHRPQPPRRHRRAPDRHRPAPQWAAVLPVPRRSGPGAPARCPPRRVPARCAHRRPAPAARPPQRPARAALPRQRPARAARPPPRPAPPPRVGTPGRGASAPGAAAGSPRATGSAAGVASPWRDRGVEMTEQTTGSVIAGYRIESVIGRGGMATVYRAEDTRLGRKVALKLLSTALAANEQFRQRFIRESRLAASLDHPNIVPIYEAGDADGVLFIAMRYVVGSDMKDLLARDGALDPERAVRLFTQIGDALDAAHELGLVHRDVKPGNILITHTHEHGDHVTAEHVYLTDFGLTKRSSSLSGGLTGTGHFLGTVDYVAPEQIQGKPVGPAADMYALGCLLYECLTGRVPFRRDDDAAVLWAHLIEAPPPPAVLRPELPTGVNAVVARAMAKFPEERFASCHEMVRALADAVREPGADSEGAAVALGPAAGGQQTRWSGERAVPDVPAGDAADMQAGAAAGALGAAAAPDVDGALGEVGDQAEAQAGEWAQAGPGEDWAEAGWAEQVQAPDADAAAAEQWGWDGEGTSWPLEEELVAGEVVGTEAPGVEGSAAEPAVAATSQAQGQAPPASLKRRWLLPVVA